MIDGMWRSASDKKATPLFNEAGRTAAPRLAADPSTAAAPVSSLRLTPSEKPVIVRKEGEKADGEGEEKGWVGEDDGEDDAARIIEPKNTSKKPPQAIRGDENGESSASSRRFPSVR